MAPCTNNIIKKLQLSKMFSCIMLISYVYKQNLVSQSNDPPKVMSANGLYSSGPVFSSLFAALRGTRPHAPTQPSPPEHSEERRKTGPELD